MTLGCFVNGPVRQQLLRQQAVRQLVLSTPVKFAALLPDDFIFCLTPILYLIWDTYRPILT